MKKTVPIFLFCLINLLVFTCSNQKEKVYHIGILSGLNYFNSITDGFKQKMDEMGYVEGKNVLYDIQQTNIDTNAYRTILKKFVVEKVDLIFSFPTEASIEAKTITRNTGIPVVFANAFTENTGLITTIREPGDNITGVRWPGPDMALQRLEIMCELVPKAVNIWVIYKKNYPTVTDQINELHKVCNREGLKLIEISAADTTELTLNLKTRMIKGPRPDGILMIVEPFTIIPGVFLELARYAEKLKIPLGGANMSVDGYESVFGLIPQNIPQGRQSAFLADKILKGTKAGTIPVVSADCYLLLNYKAATKLGLTVSDLLIGRADKVIR